MARQLAITIEQEDDGRWIAEIQELPGVMTFGETAADARAKVEALALRVLADRREHVGHEAAERLAAQSPYTLAELLDPASLPLDSSET